MSQKLEHPEAPVNRQLASSHEKCRSQGEFVLEESMSRTAPVLRYLTFAIGASVSDVADITGLEVDAVRMPAAWTAAQLAFDETPDPSNLGSNALMPIIDDGGGVDTPAELRLPVVTGASMRLRDKLFGPYHGLRLRSVAAGVAATATAAPVTQAAQAVFVLICRQVASD
jgi:hypothetical protein